MVSQVEILPPVFTIDIPEKAIYLGSTISFVALWMDSALNDPYAKLRCGSKVNFLDVPIFLLQKLIKF